MKTIFEFFQNVRDAFLLWREFRKTKHLLNQHRINILVCGSEERYHELRGKYPDPF